MAATTPRPPDQFLVLSNYPIISITNVSVDGTVLASTEYTSLASKGMLRRESGWPEGYRKYRVQYTAGYATVPEDIQEATAQWVSALFWQTKDNVAIYPTLPPASVYALIEPFITTTRGR